MSSIPAADLGTHLQDRSLTCNDVRRPNILRGTISQKLVDAVESIQKEVGSVSVARVAGDLENPVVAERAWSKDELKVLFKAAGTRTAVKGSAEEQAQIYAKNKVASLQVSFSNIRRPDND